MVFWCYFLDKWDTKIEKQICTNNVVTFPIKRKLSDGDLVIFYIKGGDGFIGYVRIAERMEHNIDKKGKSIINIFPDKLLNEYSAVIKFNKFLKKGIMLKDISNTNMVYGNKIKALLMKHEYFMNMQEEVGDFIRLAIKEKYADTMEIIPQVILKSKYLIPILIIPCEKMRTEMRKISEDDKIQWLFDHIAYCRKCDITNNNERIGFDLIYDKAMTLRKMTDYDEIEELIDTYYGVGYYKKKSLKENHMRIIKITNNTSYYNGCYCIVGKLDTSY